MSNRHQPDSSTVRKRRFRGLSGASLGPDMARSYDTTSQETGPAEGGEALDAEHDGQNTDKNAGDLLHSQNRASPAWLALQAIARRGQGGRLVSGRALACWPKHTRTACFHSNPGSPRYAIPRLDAGELKDTPEFVRRVERLRRKYPEKRYHWRMVRLVQHRYFLEGKYDLSTRWCIDVLAQPEEAIIVPPDDSIPLDWLYDGVLIALVDSVLAKARSPKQERKCVSRLVEELASSPQTAPYSDRVAGIAKKYFGRTSLVKTARDEDGRGRTSRNLFGETSVGVSEKKVNHLPDAVAVAGATNGSRNGRRFIIWVASALLVLFTITIRIWWGNRRGRG